MKILVTGANGFLGKHILAELLSAGHVIVALVRDVSNSPPPSSRLCVLPGDISDLLLPHRLADMNIEHLMHLAWGSVRKVNDEQHLTSQLPAHIRFLRAMCDLGIRSLSVAGSCLEYGQREGELTEDHLVDPETPYGCAKNLLREELERIPNLAMTWARFFYVYGPGQDDESLFGSISLATARGETTFQLREPGTQRDFIPVKEAARIFCALATGGHRGTFNVCQGRARSVRDVAEEIRADLGSAVRFAGEDSAAGGQNTSSPFWGGARKAMDAVGLTRRQ